MASCAPAVPKIFALPELVENILRGLECHQLFAVQRVNTTFRNVIRTSKQIRWAMFYIQGPESDFETAVSENRILNPILKRPILVKDFSFGISIDPEQNFITLHVITSDPLEALQALLQALEFTSQRGRQASGLDTYVFSSPVPSHLSKTVQLSLFFADPDCSHWPVYEPTHDQIITGGQLLAYLVGAINEYQAHRSPPDVDESTQLAQWQRTCEVQASLDAILRRLQ